MSENNEIELWIGGIDYTKTRVDILEFFALKGISVRIVKFPTGKFGQDSSNEFSDSCNRGYLVVSVTQDFLRDVLDLDGKSPDELCGSPTRSLSVRLFRRQKPQAD